MKFNLKDQQKNAKEGSNRVLLQGTIITTDLGDPGAYFCEILMKKV